MDKVTIPPEVVEAMARACHQQWRESCSEASHEPISNWQEWEYLTVDDQADWRGQALAAARAMLAAWPGAEWIGVWWLLLPIPQETKP